MDEHRGIDCWKRVWSQTWRTFGKAFWALFWATMLASLLSNPIFWLVGLDPHAEGALRIMGALCLMSLAAGVIGWLEGRYGHAPPQ